jgi:hypothetical protein
MKDGLNENPTKPDVIRADFFVVSATILTDWAIDPADRKRAMERLNNDLLAVKHTLIGGDVVPHSIFLGYGRNFITVISHEAMFFI